jgi:hypothetical protein
LGILHQDRFGIRAKYHRKIVPFVTLVRLIFHLLLIEIGVINPTYASYTQAVLGWFPITRRCYSTHVLLIARFPEYFAQSLKKENVEMSIKKMLVLTGTLIIAMFILAACAGPAGTAGPAGPAGAAGATGPAGAAPKAADLTCTQCHNDTTLISGKVSAWSTSHHGSGQTFGYAGGRPGCNGCHSGGGFADRIAANMKTADIKTADANPSSIDCRACHKIHTTYTKDDFALRTTAAVTLETTGATYDGGMGNLCANCHQPQAAVPAPAADGTVKITSTYWGAHHGPVSAMLLGVGGSPDVKGTPSPHYSTVKDTCVTCHMGATALRHSFMPLYSLGGHGSPILDECIKCHADAKNFDMKGAVTALDAKIAAVKTALTKAGLLDSTGAINAKAVNQPTPSAKAYALWNYLMVTEDKSHGVHNMNYANALLDAALAALK